MRTLSILLLLAASAALAPAAEDPSLTGKWQLQLSAAGRESRLECTFDQKSADLTGTCTNDRGTQQLTGKVEGKTANWTFKSDSEAGPVTVVFKGTLESPTKITGTVTAVEFSVEGEFTATLSK